MIQSGKYYDLIDNALTLDPKTEAYKLAKGMQDGSLHANSYNIGGLMKAYVETNGNAAFMYDMPQAKGSSVNTAEQYVEKLAGLNQNAKASAEVADTISSFVTAMQDMGDAIPAEVHDTIMAAYRTFEAGGTNNNAFTVMQTALQSIDSAIGTQLVSGGDVTGLLALRSRMESGLGGTVRGKSAVNTKAMADAVDMLMRLPADVQAAIDVDALSKAYFDYLTAGKADKAAAQGKAVDLLFDSAQAAIATGKLDAATVQKLEGLMAEIDSERGVGDNENIIGIINEQRALVRHWRNLLNIDIGTFRKIRNLKRGKRPDPNTYITKAKIDKHLALFEGGVTKIAANEPKGTVGPPGGTFVMPKWVADRIILKSKGDISKLETLLALDPGILGTNPVRIDIMAPKGLRMPSGNEFGANKQWIPGGYTSSGTLEATIDPVEPNDYIINIVF